MKAIFLKSFFFFFAICLWARGSTQTLPSGQAAKFGIDGDIQSDERQNGTFIAAGSHDWFKKPGGAGLGLIDTAGGSEYRKQMMAGNNIAFSKRMQFKRFSVQDGVVVMDACYSRDFMSNDKTSFSGVGTKNTSSPASWGTSPSGGNVSDKTDILDSYVSMRRSGTELTGSNAGNLIATMALSTLATGGDRYADFEFYKERINYNTATGKFENSGPAAYGGHGVWEFNADGSIRSWGDMTISFSFNSSSVSDIKILIWVSKSTFLGVNPKGFDFVATEFYESTSAAGYGYAGIKPDAVDQLAALGAVNTSLTSVPVWGGNSKDNGSNTNYYFTDWYSIGQFAEASVDLTVLGIDPASFMNMNGCNPPFTRFMTKSRSSSSFSSALSDFDGPFEFLDVPTVPAMMTKPASFGCITQSLNLSPASYVNGAYYSWRTTDGNITGSNSDSSLISINKTGTYHLTAAIMKACAANTDSIVVTEDKVQPVATASVSGMLFPGQKVTLYGGDAIASNFSTPNGGSQGLLWDWKGPLGFTSMEQNPQTGYPGEFTLVVTEIRNGCKDTALVYVVPYPTLPQSFLDFTITTNQQRGLHQLSWKVTDAGSIKQFVLEKCLSGNSFFAIATIPAEPGKTTYLYEDAILHESIGYRVRAEEKDGKIVYSRVVDTKSESTDNSLSAAFVDERKNLVFSHTATQNEIVSLQVSNQNGQLLWKKQVETSAGNKQYRVALPQNIIPGIYFIKLEGRQKTVSIKVRM